MPELRSFLSTASLAALLLMACTDHPQATDGPSRPTAGVPGAGTCALQVIVSFAPGVHTPPEDGLMKDLSRVSGVNLVYLRSVNPELHLFSLSAVGDDCGKAVERLRSDPRVRSVDVDQRRQHH